MGILMSRIFESLFGSKEVRILILGLDNAGKTTILYRLQNESDEAVQTIPTIGFNVETLQYKNIKVRGQWIGRSNERDRWGMVSHCTRHGRSPVVSQRNDFATLLAWKEKTMRTTQIELVFFKLFWLCYGLTNSDLHLLNSSKYGT